MDIETVGVFQVFTGSGTGSGFLIDPQHLVTNCHVVSPYRSVGVEMRDKLRALGQVRRIHPKRDLAIVELSEPIDLTVLPMETTEPLRTKQTVHILGFPAGLPLSLTEGVVSHPKQAFEGQDYLQTDAAINPGNSGGPILNDLWKIVGVTTCKLRSAESVGFGIPAADVERFVRDFRNQNAPFGVECPSCDALIAKNTRYCNECGADLEVHEIETYFEPPEQHPVVRFVEEALTKANVDPVLARHGEQNWSFYSGSAPIQVWCCCSEHLCFGSPLAQVGKQRVGELFRHLLSPEHHPFNFDLVDTVVRLNLTIHMSDIFGTEDHDELAERIRTFIAAADRYDNHLIESFGCSPAPKTQLTFLKEGATGKG